MDVPLTFNSYHSRGLVDGSVTDYSRPAQEGGPVDHNISYGSPIRTPSHSQSPLESLLFSKDDGEREET